MPSWLPWPARSKPTGKHQNIHFATFKSTSLSEKQFAHRHTYVARTDSIAACLSGVPLCYIALEHAVEALSQIWVSGCYLQVGSCSILLVKHPEDNTTGFDNFMKHFLLSGSKPSFFSIEILQSIQIKFVPVPFLGLQQTQAQTR